MVAVVLGSKRVELQKRRKIVIEYGSVEIGGDRGKEVARHAQSKSVAVPTSFRRRGSLHHWRICSRRFPKVGISIIALESLRGSNQVESIIWRRDRSYKIEKLDEKQVGMKELIDKLI